MKITVDNNGVYSFFEITEKMFITDALKDNDILIDQPCGGKEVCGQCKVIAKGEITDITYQERKIISEKDLEKGYRLSCSTKLVGDATIILEREPDIQGVHGSSEGEISQENPLYKTSGVVIDLGTTTLYAEHYNKRGILAKAAVKNPQTIYGADVISRMEASIKGCTEELGDLIRKALWKLIEKVQGEKADLFLITGNTAMLYLLMKKDPKSIALSPFIADDLFGRFYSGKDIFKKASMNSILYLPRCISAYLGADISTAFLASEIYKSNNTSVLVDIGTNGEILLWNKGILYGCSTAAGPAFEGAGIVHGSYGVSGAIDKIWHVNGKIQYTTINKIPARSICGSGIIDGIAVLLDRGILKKSGAFFSQKESVEIGNGIKIFKKDIRSIQMAKSAIQAGIRSLVYGADIDLDQVEKLYIAGGFGNYLNLKNATAIGLIPSKWLDFTSVIGNAALKGGALMMGNKELIKEQDQRIKDVKVVSLERNPFFEEKFIEGMYLSKI